MKSDIRWRAWGMGPAEGLTSEEVFSSSVRLQILWLFGNLDESVEGHVEM